MSNANSTVEKNPLEDSFIRLKDDASRETQGIADPNNRQELSTMAAIERGLERVRILFGPNGLIPATGENLFYPKVCEYNVDIFNPFKQGV